MVETALSLCLPCASKGKGQIWVTDGDVKPGLIGSFSVRAKGGNYWIIGMNKNLGVIKSGLVDMKSLGVETIQ